MSTEKKSPSPHFEMAHVDNPVDVIQATQRSIMGALRSLFKGLQEDVKHQPGLTWSQIDTVLEIFEKKEPIIITQTEEM